MNHDAFRRPVAGAQASLDDSLDASLGVEADGEDAVDVDVLHDGFWKAWQG